MQGIPPTVGRKVWYRPNGYAGTLMVELDKKTPMDATIIYVHDHNTVNLLVVDHVGLVWPLEHVTLMQFPEPKIGHTFPDHYCEWMPFQVGQAKAVADVGKVGSGSAA